MKRKEKQKNDFSLVILVFILSILIGSIFYVYIKIQTDAYNTYMSENENANIMLIVSDKNHLYLSQIFMYNINSLRSAIIDIPPNYGLIIEAKDQFNKIELIYKDQGIKNYILQVEDEFNINIPYYLEIDINDMKDIVDLLGGIELNNLDNIDQIKKNYMYLIPSGKNLLDGDKIINYINYNYLEEKDFDKKVNNKWSFTQAFLKSISEKGSYIEENKQISNLIINKININLDKRSFFSLLESLNSIDYSNVINQIVSGSVQEVETLYNENIDLFFVNEKSGGWGIWDQIDKINEVLSNKEEDKVKDQLKNSNINIEILNATDIDKLASSTKEYYKNMGFNVLKSDNYKGLRQAKTQIIEHKGNRELAKIVADKIEFDNSRVTTDIKEENIDVTVVLGNDYDKDTNKIRKD